MTAKEFDEVIWYKGIKVKYWGKIREVMSVNFATRYLTLKFDFGYSTVKHSKCEIINE